MGNKFSISRTWRIACIDFYKWIINSRMIVAAAMIVFVWSFAVTPLMDISKEMGSPLNFIEPFIAVLNSRVLCLVTPAVYIFLISDYPRLDRNSLFVLHRINKREWVLGQFIFFTLSAFAFTAIIFIASLIPNCMNSFVANGWSLVVTKYGVYNPERAYSFAASLIKEELYNQIAPYQAAVTSFLLNFLYMLTLAMVLLLFHVLNLRKIGVPVSISIIAVGSALGILKSQGMWYFPMAHTMVHLHFTKHLKEPIMSINSSFLYFGLIISAIIIFCLIWVKHTNFLNIDDNE